MDEQKEDHNNEACAYEKMAETASYQQETKENNNHKEDKEGY